MDIVVWLRSLGLGKYEAAFRENELDETILPNLTAEDLKDLGVSIVGHRRKILDAIAALRTDASLKAPPATVRQSHATQTTVAPVAEAVGERRHVTVMFCDLVGSTSISAGLDAEDWRDLVGAYLDAASAAVTEMGGHVAKKLGDGLMALFGYPVAQGNDAERAARGALSIQRALAEVNRKNAGSGKPALNARIGIETGPVVIDAAGEIYGDAPNVAARVQALAEPGTVVMTVRVQHQDVGARQQRARKSASQPTVELHALVTTQSSDGIQQLDTVPERCDAKLLQVLFRQARKDSLVYLVLAEYRLILPEAQAPQPDHDVHDGAYNRGWRASSAGEARVSRVALGSQASQST